jgi:hypothetical protein
VKTPVGGGEVLGRQTQLKNIITQAKNAGKKYKE